MVWKSSNLNLSLTMTWQMTKRRGGREVHKFVEIMAPVFSHAAWQCVWHLIQLAHEKISVVDSQWIVHQVIPFLGRPSRVHADAVEIGTFRTYTEGYKPLDEPVS
ncbi:Storage protein [Cucumis melo var. makuwa]|uniref:Storage protein n=1 Tax=Cucumis melo var. makuwa TaxID=1194695 RepID=A0A5D3BI08_CUCMM|nr:Storage protein [Cucumis melo var. makuwa]